MTTPTTTAPQTDLVERCLATFTECLHHADALTLAHKAEDVEAMEPSPLTLCMRAAVDAERQLRAEPTFREVAERDGWNEAADRVNRWSAAGYVGNWWDAEYDVPSPVDAEDGAA